MTNIYKIAEITGFSPTTVSKVINNYPDVSDKTRKLIQEALKEHNFLPNSIARSLSTKKTWTIGVVYQDGDAIGFNHPFFGNVLQAFRKRCEELGYSLLFACKNDAMGGSSVADYLIQKRVEGVLLLSTCGETAEVKQLINSSLPIAAVDYNMDGVASVCSDNEEGVRLAVKHLYELGHRRIGYITGGYDGENWISDLRKKTFCEVSKELDLKLLDSYVQKGYNFELDGGIEAAIKFLELEESIRPTAICCASDFQAIGVMKVLKEAGICVPEDLSVIGFDNIPFTEFLTPPLSTIHQNAHQIGIECADLLGEQIHSKTKTFDKVCVPVSIVERGTCAPPRASLASN